MTHTLSEHESKQLLADAGIPIPEQRLVSSADEAVSAAEELGYPVALKLCGRGIAHKTERNLVRLDVGSAEEVREQAGQLLAERRPEESDSGVLIQAMVSGRRELIAGLLRDPQFGPCVMLGLGGVFAELIGDVAFAINDALLFYFIVVEADIDVRWVVPVRANHQRIWVLGLRWV